MCPKNKVPSRTHATENILFWTIFWCAHESSDAIKYVSLKWVSV